MQVKKQQLEPDMEQRTGSILGKGYIKAVYCPPCLFNVYAEVGPWEPCSLLHLCHLAHSKCFMDIWRWMDEWFWLSKVKKPRTLPNPWARGCWSDTVLRAQAMELSCLNSHPSNPSYFPLCRLWLSGWLHGHSYFLLAPGGHIAMLFPWGPRPIAGSSSSLLEEKKKKRNFYFLAALHSKGDLSSWARDWTCTSSIGSAES